MTVMSKLWSYTGATMSAAAAIPCLWAVIGLSFMCTAPSNWHATVLNEKCLQKVPIEREDIKPLFGMLTHAAFFIGELNWGIASVHIMNWLGFHPAIAATPIITTIGLGIAKLKLGKGGPTGLPISGPPAPAPQIALSLGLVMSLNAAYQCAAGTPLKVPQYTGQHDAAQFWTAFAVICGVPNLLSQYHLATSHWTGKPVARRKGE